MSNLSTSASALAGSLTLAGTSSFTFSTDQCSFSLEGSSSSSGHYVIWREKRIFIELNYNF